MASNNKPEKFENSPEYDEWFESGGKDEDRDYYYNKWMKRVTSDLRRV